MSKKRAERQQRELDSLEREFREKLVHALEDCAGGQWGLFGQNEGVDMPARLHEQMALSSGAAALLDLGKAIETLRHELGIAEPFPLHARFRAMRGRHGANQPGEPKLARLWLEELARET